MTAPGYPFGAPTIAGTAITVETMLSEPTRITKYLSDLTLQRFIAGRIFSQGGSVTGGAVIYDQVTANDLYTSNDVQHVEPGAEFPIVNQPAGAPKVSQVEKFGGKFFVTDEARDRNDLGVIQRGTQRLANTVVRKTDTRAIEVLEAAVTEHSRTLTGVNWSTAKTTANSSLTAASSPAADIINAQLDADQDELGTVFDLWLVNPIQYANFLTFYGATNLAAILASLGVSMESSNRVAAGSAYAVDSGNVGEIRFEKPFGTETWREQGTERTWVQSSVRPVFAVTNPFAVVKVTGLAG